MISKHAMWWRVCEWFILYLGQYQVRLEMVMLAQPLCVFANLRKATISLDVFVHVSVYPSARNNSDRIERVFVKFDSFFFRKFVEKIQPSLKSDKNNGYFTRRPMYIYNNISLNYSYIEKCFSKCCRENKKKHFVFNYIFSRKSCVYEIMWKNAVQPDTSQMTIKYGACALHAA